MWLTKFTEQQQNDYQQQVTWQHPERTVLKSWAIEARDCNTFVAGLVEAIAVILILGTAITTYIEFNESINTVILISTIFFMMATLLWLLSNITRQKKLLIYRLTEQGFEVAGWRRAADNIKKIYFGTMIVCGILLLGIVIVVPQAIFMLFVGPVGMALSYIAIGNNKKMWEQERDFSQKAFDWDELEKVILFRQRCLIYFEYDTEKRKAKNIKAYGFGIFLIFCPKERYEEIIAFVKSKRPHIPYADGKVEVTALRSS